MNRPWPWTGKRQSWNELNLVEQVQHEKGIRREQFFDSVGDSSHAKASLAHTLRGFGLLLSSSELLLFMMVHLSFSIILKQTAELGDSGRLQMNTFELTFIFDVLTQQNHTTGGALLKPNDKVKTADINASHWGFLMYFSCFRVSILFLPFMFKCPFWLYYLLSFDLQIIILYFKRCSLWNILENVIIMKAALQIINEQVSSLIDLHSSSIISKLNTLQRAKRSTAAFITVRNVSRNQRNFQWSKSDQLLEGAQRLALSHSLWCDLPPCCHWQQDSSKSRFTAANQPQTTVNPKTGRPEFYHVSHSQKSSQREKGVTSVWRSDDHGETPQPCFPAERKELTSLWKWIKMERGRAEERGEKDRERSRRRERKKIQSVREREKEIEERKRQRGERRERRETQHISTQVSRSDVSPPSRRSCDIQLRKITRKVLNMFEWHF